MQLELSTIRLDGGTQPRAMYHVGIAEAYAEDMQEGAVFPPVTVFYDGADYWLADGFHRVLATENLERTTIEADVRQGTQQDAQWYSYSVNLAHGLRRSDGDKQRAVTAALAHPKAAGMSDREIADHVGVSHMTVNRARNELKPTVTVLQSNARTGRDGRTINTANIGRTKRNREKAGSVPTFTKQTEIKQNGAEPTSATIDPLVQEVDRLILRYNYEELCRLLELLAERIAVDA